MESTQTKSLMTAIEKALANGWQLPFEEPLDHVEVTHEDVNGTYQTENYIRFVFDGEYDWCVGIPHIIYNHDFARALWGEGPSNAYLPRWKMHLQRMVTASDPLKYLGANL